MSENLDGSEISPSTSSQSLGELPEIAAIPFGIDLVSAARRNIWFLRTVADSVWLHHTPIMVEAVRRSTLYTNSASLVCFLGTVISSDGGALSQVP